MPELTLSLREQQKGLAKRLIVEAAARVILRSGVFQFSMQEVADEAGVSLRTLYRYFPSREELLDGVTNEVFNDLRRVGVVPTVPDVDPSALPEAMARMVGDAFRITAERADLGRAWVVINMVSGTRNTASRGLDAMVREVVGQVGPHLTTAELDLVFGVTRYLAGSIAWKVMTDEFGMNTEQVAEAVGWALRTLLGSIESGGRPSDKN